MINVNRVRNAEFLYNRYENSTVINIELQESGMSAQTEITVSEAIEVRDKLTEEIEFIVGSSEKDLIDRDKLLEWLERELERVEQEHEQTTGLYKRNITGRHNALVDLKAEVENGTFNG